MKPKSFKTYVVKFYTFLNETIFRICHVINTLMIHVCTWKKLTYVIYDNNSNNSIKVFVIYQLSRITSGQLESSRIYNSNKTKEEIKKKNSSGKN